MAYIAATEGGFAGFNIKTDNPETLPPQEMLTMMIFLGMSISGFAILKIQSPSKIRSIQSVGY